MSSICPHPLLTALGQVSVKTTTVGSENVDWIVWIYLCALSCDLVGGGGKSSTTQLVVTVPKDKSGAPPVRSIHGDLFNVATPPNTHRQVSTQPVGVSCVCTF